MFPFLCKFLWLPLTFKKKKLNVSCETDGLARSEKIPVNYEKRYVD